MLVRRVYSAWGSANFGDGDWRGWGERNAWTILGRRRAAEGRKGERVEKRREFELTLRCISNQCGRACGPRTDRTSTRQLETESEDFLFLLTRNVPPHRNEEDVSIKVYTCFQSPSSKHFKNDSGFVEPNFATTHNYKLALVRSPAMSAKH